MLFYHNVKKLTTDFFMTAGQQHLKKREKVVE